MNVWEFIVEKYAAGFKVVLLYVVQSEGSSPGRQGFSMAVSADGNCSGSIGGGIMEHKFVEMAKAEMQNNATSSVIHRQVHNKTAVQHQSGMICSGEQRIFVHHIGPDDIFYIERLIISLNHFQNGSLKLTRTGVRFSEPVPAHNFFFNEEVDDFLFIEKSGFKQQVHIIGGGHCSLALSALMRNLDFYIVVYDDRHDLATMVDNIHAHKKVIVQDYAEINSLIPDGDDQYIVIATQGYRTDDAAVRALQGKTFKYLGILGSENKMERMFSEYKTAGEELSFAGIIYSPIGLKINSQTPAEIAISIAAEIIGVKNGAL